MMRWLLIAITVVATSSLADGPPQNSKDEASGSGITTRHKDYRDSDGRLISSSETVYRGKERILVTVIFTGQRSTDVPGSGWRTYYLHGEPRVLEEDRTGNGSNVMVRVYGNGLDDFEAFRRRDGGQLEPVTGAELMEMKREQAQIEAGVNAMGAVIKNAVDTHTNVDEAMDSIKKTGAELRKSLDEKAKETGKK